MAIDKHNPVDRKEFVEMAGVVGVGGGATVTPQTAPVITIADPFDSADIKAAIDSVVAKLVSAGVFTA